MPLGFALGGILCRIFLLHAPSRIAIDRAQPLVVVTYWHNFGALMWLALFIAVAISSAGYVGVLRAGPRQARPWFDKLTMTPIVVTQCLCVLACIAALAFPVVFSSDVYAYAGYGWMALHGIDPYAHARLTSHDPLIRAVIWQWANPPPISVYGPVFVWFAKAIVALFGSFGPAAPLWALRIAACATLVACVPLAYNAFDGFSQEKRLAAAAGIALNPIAIWSCAEGHNDVYIVALGLGAYALMQSGRPFAGALFAGLSPLLKLPGVLAAIVAACTMRKQTAKLLQIVLGTAIGFGISLGVMWPMIASVRSHIVAGGHYLPQFSLQYMMTLVASPKLAVALTAALVLILACAALAQVSKDSLVAAATLAIAVWIALPNPWPWYALWILPLAFIAWEAPASWALIALALCSVARYFPDATVTPFGAMPSVAVALFQLGVPLAAFIVGTISSRQVRREIHTPVPDLEFSRYS